MCFVQYHSTGFPLTLLYCTLGSFASLADSASEAGRRDGGTGVIAFRANEN